MEFQDIPAIAPLVGHTIGELFSERDAFAIGEIIMLFEMETVAVAELMEIDPFDQPAVEESKVLTREYLAKFGSQ